MTGQRETMTGQRETMTGRREAMTAGERMWLWSQPAVAVAAALAGSFAWYLQLSGDVSTLPTLQALITGSFVLPGLALSLSINHVAVMLRKPPMLTVGEKLLLIIEFGLVIAVVAISPSPDLLFLGYLLWPLLIAAAATAFATMVSTTIRSRRPHDESDAAETNGTSAHESASAASLR